MVEIMKRDKGCQRCQFTGYIKYKPIDGMTIYSWIPWEIKNCPCMNIKERKF